MKVILLNQKLSRISAKLGERDGSTEAQIMPYYNSLCRSTLIYIWIIFFIVSGQYLAVFKDYSCLCTRDHSWCSLRDHIQCWESNQADYMKSKCLTPILRPFWILFANAFNVNEYIYLYMHIYIHMCKYITCIYHTLHIFNTYILHIYECILYITEILLAASNRKPKPNRSLRNKSTYFILWKCWKWIPTFPFTTVFGGVLARKRK